MLLELQNFKEILEMPATNKGIFSRPPKYQTFPNVLETCEKSAAKDSIEKLLNFVDLSTIFSPRLFEETYFHP